MVRELFLLVPAILVALTFHEYAHGWMALRFGDPTAKMAGRLTFNPISHLDPIGTLMLLLVHIGWAKPVPVDPRYFQNPKRDMLWVALAGPGTNMILAFISGILLANFGLIGIEIIGRMLYMSLYINLILAAFNMLPIPPLDGSRVLRSLLPYRYEHTLYALEQYGPWILMAIIIFGRMTGSRILWTFIGPFVDFFSTLFTFGLL